MPSKAKKYHSGKESVFYKLRSKSKLSQLLFVGSKKLQDIAIAKELYFEFPKEKKSGGTRIISAPREDLKNIQKRIADLLHRLTPPDYLFAPVSGRSYVDNAARHLGAKSIHLLDIEDFFPSCSANKVIWFFSKRMLCSPDVSAILRGIVTHKEALPQGSPCSPILAYLCYIDMWEEIDCLVSKCDCRLSVYADDLTISGTTIPERLIWDIKKTLCRHGHSYKRSKEKSKYGKPAEITGVILYRDRLSAPNRQHQKLHAVRNELRLTGAKKARPQLKNQTPWTPIADGTDRSSSNCRLSFKLRVFTELFPACMNYKNL